MLVEEKAFASLSSAARLSLPIVQRTRGFAPPPLDGFAISLAIQLIDKSVPDL
jgi:hypothetical protein